MSVLKKTVVVLAIVVFVMLIGLKPVLKRNPPLESATLGWTQDKHAVVMAIGNKGWRKIKLTDVLVNNNEQPLNVKIQVSNPTEPFIISDSFKDRKKSIIKDIDDVEIKPHTSLTNSLKKVNNGTSTKKDRTYGLSIVQNKSIHQVIIKYRYLSIPFVKEIAVK
ncbi:hypothetical protein ACFCYN_14200 [Gottfriedia sp. NPDC056225]|uniref:hypothetical protein n=1 Tax=Gottfriedia sp. NPDC056225 TaxID=3345751 RepID=UPI0035DB9D52